MEKSLSDLVGIVRDWPLLSLLLLTLLTLLISIIPTPLVTSQNLCVLSCCFEYKVSPTKILILRNRHYLFIQNFDFFF